MIQDVLVAYAVAYAAIMICVTALWAVSLRIRDISIIDLFWGLGFVVIAAVVFAALRPASLYALAVAAMPTLWAARYSSHIFPRNWGKGEDPRYAKLRKWVPEGRAFAWFSLKQVFLLQGHVMVAIASPVIVAMALDGPMHMPALLYLGAAVWAAGVGIEAVADAQLKAFKRDPSNRGLVLDRGLWRYSRHPNYFGDALMWWGIWIAASANFWAAPTVIGPILMTHFLVNVTGVATLDKKMAKEKPGYRAYMARTSGFVPWPPKQAADDAG